MTSKVNPGRYRPWANQSYSTLSSWCLVSELSYIELASFDSAPATMTSTTHYHLWPPSWVHSTASSQSTASSKSYAGRNQRGPGRTFRLWARRWVFR